MQASEYRPPGRDDYANVTALNQAWLGATTTLKPPQRARLAAAPLLLFSLREGDAAWWDRVLARQGTLLLPPQSELPVPETLQAAALAFAWQLARSNPYAARVLAGAPSAWCERIAAVPLLTLVRAASGRPDLCRPRFGNASRDRLVSCLTSEQEALRRSAQFVALQGLLTGLDEVALRPMRTAACRVRGGRLQVAERAADANRRRR